MILSDFAAKLNCSVSEASEFLKDHNITMFRGNIDLSPSILSAIVESGRNLQNRNYEKKSINRKIDWVDGHQVELIHDIHKFKKNDDVVYAKSLCMVNENLSENDNSYSITIVNGGEVISGVSGDNLILVKVLK